MGDYLVCLDGEEYHVRAKFYPASRGGREQPDEPDEWEIDYVDHDGERYEPDEDFRERLAEALTDQLEGERHRV